MRKRFKNTLYIISFLLMCSFCLGGFYLAYDKYAGSKPVVKVSGPLSINFASGNKLDITGSKTVSISVINDSSEAAYYYIEFKNVENAKDVTYTLSKDDQTISDELHPYNSIISSYVLIEGGESQVYELAFKGEAEAEYSLEVDINAETMETNNFADVILKNNEVRTSPVTEAGKNIAQGAEGLVSASDDYGTTYYFRGKVDNNYVKLDDYVFRIVRINGDGSVKLILDGETETLQKYYNETQYAYDGSALKTYLNEWVNANLSDYSDFIANQKYCNDLGMKDGIYTASVRLETDNIPSFHCLGEKVISKAGLITADEVIFAGATLEEENKEFYLYNENVSNAMYTMTSAKMDSDNYYPYSVTTTGQLTGASIGSGYLSIRPVITIIKTAQVEGEGTVNNPYTLLKQS